jgi:membrane protease YdiL (CAAX protease family)
MKKQMQLSFLGQRYEFAHPKKYNGNHEVKFAITGCLIWFVAIIIRLGISEEKRWTLIEQIVEALSFVVFSGIPIFFLATPQGSKFAKNVLVKNNGLWFQVIFCTNLAIYISCVKFLELSPDKFIWLDQMNDLIVKDNFWLNSSLFLLGAFAALRLPFLILKFRKANNITNLQNSTKFYRDNSQAFILLGINFIYIVASHTSLISTYFKPNYLEGYYIGFGYLLAFFMMNLQVCKNTPPDKLMIFDLLLILICISILFWFSTPFFSFGIFIGIDLFIVVIIYGIGLEREHFGYSFQPQMKDIGYLFKQVLLAFLVLVPLALTSGFVQVSFFKTNPGILKLLSYFVLFSFRVGIFEEILFRSGLMTFIRDQLISSSREKLNVKYLVFFPAFICSIIFGISHIGNQPGAGSLLTPLAYKTAYVGLATLASLFYSLAFGETNRLWCSIMIHGFVDTVTVVFLGGFITVPF